jgi:hypothetical protein
MQEKEHLDLNVSPTPTKPLDTEELFLPEEEVPGDPNIHNPSNSEGEPETPITIPLPHGQSAYVSPIDADLAALRWHVGVKDGQVQHQKREGEKKRYIYLHREVAQRILDRPLTREDFIAHKNENKLDNTRENILPLTRSERLHRIELNKRNTSGYRGVSKIKDKNRWEAKITVSGKTKKLGWHDTPEDAARAYNDAALLYYKENARLNEIPDREQENTIVDFNQDKQE